MPNPTIFTSVINSYLPEPHASLLNGIIFGADLKTSKIFYEQLKTVGIVHIVVLSGINITLLGAVIASLTGYFGKIVSSLLTILIIVLFILFVGAKAPIIRAGCMGILTLVAFLYGRRNFAYFALFLSAIFTFIVWPEWLATVSFQLSYAATLGLLIFGKTAGIKTERKFLAGISNEFRITLAAQVFTAPLIFFYFKQISLISPLTNVFIAFTIAPLMIFGFLTAFLGKIHHLLGLIPAYLCYGILSYIIFIVETFSRIPFASIKF